MLDSWVLLALAVPLLVYLYLSRVYRHWSSRGVPQPPVVFGFGNVLDAILLRSNLGFILNDTYRKFSNREAVGIYEFFSPQLLVVSPKLVQRILISDFSSFRDNAFNVNQKDPFYLDPFCQKGEVWKHQRSKLTSTMTPTKIKELFPLTKEVIPRLEAYIADNLGKDINAKTLATLFTMDNVSNTVFGVSSNCFTDPDASFRKIADIQMKETLQEAWKTVVLFFFPRIRDLLGLYFTPLAVSDFVDNMTKEVLQHRQKNNVFRNDLFQVFMKKEGNNLKEMSFYALTFFLEGFETSSMVLSWALYELAMNPQVQERLHEELLGLNGDLEYEAITGLPYLEQVYLETLRKYPAMYSLFKECTKDITLEIEGNSVEIKTGTKVLIPVFSLQRDPRYFPEPDKFDPERFSKGGEDRPQGTFLPFGEGPRICPGMRFSAIQIKLFLAHVVLNYRVLRTPQTPASITFHPGAFMVVPNEELMVALERRPERGPR